MKLAGNSNRGEIAVCSPDPRRISDGASCQNWPSVETVTAISHGAKGHVAQVYETATGRQVGPRLAFSTTRYIESDVVLMDEALSAGDRTFRKKCEDVFESYRNNDRTFLFASHDIEFVRRFCTKTLWLHHGQQMAFGDTELVLQNYQGGK